MDGWDVALLVAAGYVAVSALVRLTLRRREQMLHELRRQVAARQQDGQQQDDFPRRQSA
jgi:hypothetical protein